MSLRGAASAFWVSEASAVGEDIALGGQASPVPLGGQASPVPLGGHASPVQLTSTSTSSLVLLETRSQHFRPLRKEILLAARLPVHVLSMHRALRLCQMPCPCDASVAEGPNSHALDVLQELFMVPEVIGFWRARYPALIPPEHLLHERAHSPGDLGRAPHIQIGPAVVLASAPDGEVHRIADP